MDKKPGQFKLCLTSIDDLDKAKAIAHELLQQKRVACVNISEKATSLYHWNGKIVEDQEYLIQMKTISQNIGEIELIIGKLHSYDVPEFIVMDIEDGTPAYLSWIQSSVTE